MRVQLLFLFFLASVSAANYKFILDCGSSGVKIALYGATCPTLTGTDCKKGYKTDKLLTIANDEDVKAKFVDFFNWYTDKIREVDTSAKVDIVAYATAGNRIVSTSDDTKAWGVKSAIVGSHITADPNSWKLLHGTEEAMAEFIAVNFVSQPTKTVDEEISQSTFGSWVNMVSLGGASAQLAIPLNSDQKIDAAFEGGYQQWHDSEYWRTHTICNSEQYTWDSIVIGVYDSSSKLKFRMLYTSGADDQRIDTLKANCAADGGSGNSKACVLFISFLSGFDTTQPCGVSGSISQSALKSKVTGKKCVRNLMGGLDQTEALYAHVAVGDKTAIKDAPQGDVKSCKNSKTGVDFVTSAGVSWEEFLAHDCQLSYVSLFLTMNIPGDADKGGVDLVSPFIGMTWTASGTMASRNFKFRCVTEFTSAYLKLIGASTVNDFDGGDWTDGIARVLGLKKCNMNAVTGFTGPACGNKVLHPISSSSMWHSLEEGSLRELEAAISNLL